VSAAADPAAAWARPRVGVVGHVEWMTFAVVDRVPPAGAIAHARETFAVAAGGGAVAAVQLARLAGSALLLTALGDDAAGASAGAELTDRGVEVRAARRGDRRTRRGWCYVDEAHERTITMLDPRVVPHGADSLPWERCADLDAVYVTGGDADAVRHARRARVVVATARAAQPLRAASIGVDVLIASGSDPGEQLDPASLDPEPELVVLTAGGEGGTWRARGGASGSWPAAAPPGPPVDAYGCGDAFAAGLTYGLGAGLALERALALAARCGAHVLTGRGPYGAMLSGGEAGARG
jgi:ribokinase